MSLLPTNHDEFRTKQYWDDFFLKRGDAAFEWYGSYKELIPVLRPHVKVDDHVLNIGCGNSTISVDLYDNGFHRISNLDFSDLVINEMQAKFNDREGMTWEVGDMTDMKNHNDESVNVVFDKGALDALMSVDTTEVNDKAQLMFNEISRVLSSGGRYICVTLAEKFIIKKYMTYFGSGNNSSGWSVHIYAANGAEPSPFIPLVIVATKSSGTSTAARTNSNVKLYIDHVGGSKQVTENETSSVILEKLTQIQEFHRMKYQMGKLQIGRFEPVHLWSEDGPANVPRFTIFVLDVAAQARMSMAVFMVPFGRESDYQFSSQEGLTDIAMQAGCKRLLAVCCNRPHTFPIMSELQSELSPIVMSLRLLDMNTATENIPFMALDGDSDWETIASGTSPLSGAYIVEESIDDERSDAVRRRLIFLQNQNFIQTEARLILPSNISSSGGGGKKSASKGGKKKGAAGSAKKNTTNSTAAADVEFDFTSLDAHHRAALAAIVLCPTVIQNASNTRGSATSTAKSAVNSSAEVTALVVGLGGGALPMCLQRYLPGLRLWACDMDGEMETIATQHFGYKTNARTKTLTHEGLSLIEMIAAKASTAATPSAAITSAVVADAADSSSSPLKGLESVSALDMLFIDADSKDSSLGLSAPPPPFVTVEGLQSMYNALKPGGLLLVNVVARAKPQLAGFIDRVRYVFQASAATGGAGVVYTIQASTETVNVGVIAVKGMGGAATAAGTVFNRAATTAGAATGAARQRVEREKLLERWLKDVNLSSDPLKLEEVLGELREAHGTPV